MIGEIISWEGTALDSVLKIYKDGITYKVFSKGSDLKLFKHFEEIDFNNFSKLLEMDEIDSEVLYRTIKNFFGLELDDYFTLNSGRYEMNDFMESLAIIYENQGAEDALRSWAISERTGLDLFLAAATLNDEE